MLLGQTPQKAKLRGACCDLSRGPTNNAINKGEETGPNWWDEGVLRDKSDVMGATSSSLSCAFFLPSSSHIKVKLASKSFFYANFARLSRRDCSSSFCRLPLFCCLLCVCVCARYFCSHFLSYVLWLGLFSESLLLTISLLLGIYLCYFWPALKIRLPFHYSQLLCSLIFRRLCLKRGTRKREITV